MPRAAFVIAEESSYPMREFITAVQHELELQGVPCRTYSSFPPPHPAQVYVLVSPREFVAAGGEEALPEQAMLDRTVFLTAERPEQLSGPRDVAMLARSGALFDIGQRAVVRLHQLGIPARLLRPGYCEILDHYSADVDRSRPIDVMFLGADSPGRRGQLSAMAPVLARRGCVLQLADDPLPPGETRSFLAASRWPLLGKTKVVINLHRAEAGPMGWLRMVDAFHSGAVLLSEPASQTLPFVAGEHFVVARPETMGHVLDGLLDDASRLAALRTAAFERLSQWLPLAASVSVLRAALVELIGQPISGPRRLRIPGTPIAPAVGTTVGVDELRVELRHARRELADVRSGLHQLQAAVSVPSYTRRPRLIERTKAWDAHREPLVSVLVTLEGPARDVVPGLDSLILGRLRDRELVVVGRSDSRAVSCARGWIREHPRVPSSLLTVAAGSGQAGCAAVAHDFARGSMCLRLGPGEGLFARGLEVLVAALDGDASLDFVYPMQALGHIGQPGTLVDAVARDPRRPDGGAMTRAPVLARSGALRALRSKTMELTSGGSLTRQLADLGFVGRLIPEILAWRLPTSDIELSASVEPGL